MVVVKKSDILKGVKKIEKVKIDALSGDEMYLRPLSQAEINEVDEIEAKAMGIFETNETAHRGRRQKPKSVVESKGKIFEELFSHVRRLSGIELSEDDMDTFH